MHGSGVLTRTEKGPRVEIQPMAAEAVGATALCAVALIHFIDFFSKWHETRYIAVLYLLLIAGSLAAAALLLVGNRRAGWLLGGTLAALTFTGYIISREWGLPRAASDVGKWTESLGAASMFIEGIVVVLSAVMIRIHRSATGSR